MTLEKSTHNSKLINDNNYNITTTTTTTINTNTTTTITTITNNNNNNNNMKIFYYLIYPHFIIITFTRSKLLYTMYITKYLCIYIYI